MCVGEFSDDFLTKTDPSAVYRPNLKQKSDAELLRDAKMEAMGIVPRDDQHRRPHHERTQMATDELV